MRTHERRGTCTAVRRTRATWRNILLTRRRWVGWRQVPLAQDGDPLAGSGGGGGGGLAPHLPGRKDSAIGARCGYILSPLLRWVPAA
eukprot:1180819-Prorocentrum_minimum.AAC.1